MIPAVLPEHNRIFILVEGRRCIVARYQQTATYEYAVEYASNWPDLEAEAKQAVEDQVGAITEDGHFPCPEALAARAVWP
jgi:hypothetical protein